MVGRTGEGCIVRIKHISKQSGTEEFQWVWVWVGGFDAVDNWRAMDLFRTFIYFILYAGLLRLTSGVSLSLQRLALYPGIR